MDCLCVCLCVGFCVGFCVGLRGWLECLAGLVKKNMVICVVVCLFGLVSFLFGRETHKQGVKFSNYKNDTSFVDVV